MIGMWLWIHERVCGCSMEWNGMEWSGSTMTAVVSIRMNGTSASTLSGGSTPARGRGVCQGWSSGAARRCNAFLQSIDYVTLSGQPWALTLTIPAATADSQLPDSVAFHAMLRAMVERLRRMGAARWVWVIELTRAGTPHVHMTVWLPAGPSAAERQSAIVEAWVAVTAGRGLQVSPSGQYVTRMTTDGWSQYMSKHGASGVRSYQRQRGSLTESWRDRPGRMWGHGGEWPTAAERAPYRLQLGQAAFWRYRRLVRAYCLSRARQSGDRRWIRQARTMLRCTRPALSAVRPLTVWIPVWVSHEIVLQLQIDYQRRLEAAGGDLQAVEPWSVEDYVPLDVRRQALQRAEAAAAFSAAM